jgi:hypothetical protein
VERVVRTSGLETKLGAGCLLVSLKKAQRYEDTASSGSFVRDTKETKRSEDKASSGSFARTRRQEIYSAPGKGSYHQ